MLGREPMLGRELPKLGRATLRVFEEPDEPKLGRRTLLVRLEAALGRLPAGRLTDGRAITARLLELPVEEGRRTLAVREGFTRGWLTIVRLGLERGAVLVSAGPLPARPTTLGRDIVEDGGL